MWSTYIIMLPLVWALMMVKGDSVYSDEVRRISVAIGQEGSRFVDGGGRTDHVLLGGLQDTSRLQVQIPRDLTKKGGYEHQQALFGSPPYGGSLTLKMYYSNNTMCTDSDAMLPKWVRPKDDDEFESSPFILMIDRGDCTFVSKVRRAQHAGAAGVLIADNKCLCSDSDCEGPCESVEPIMADDGSGSDITIPSFLMKKTDSEKLIKEISKKSMIQIEMAWSLPHPDDRVEWTLWTNSYDPTSAAFKKDFKNVVIALGSKAYFEPHYAIFNGKALKCTEPYSNCGNLCTNGGRYCNPDPDNNRKYGISGADVVRENLRRICIWNHYGGKDAPTEDRGVGPKWWEYVVQFKSQCGTEKFTDDACIQSVMDKTDIDSDKISKCMTESGGTEEDVDNTLLEEEMNARSRHTIVVVPSIYVNNVIERGAMTVPTVLSTICAGYSDGTAPEACSCAGLTDSNEMEKCLKDGWPSGYVVVKGISWGSVLGITVAVVGIMSIVGFVYWRRTQNSMRDQVRGILAEYMPLEDMGGPDSSLVGSSFMDSSKMNQSGGKSGMMSASQTSAVV